MGCSLSAIADDEDRYDRLCQKYGEDSTGDPYSPHAKWLRDREKGRTVLAYEEYLRALSIAVLEQRIAEKKKLYTLESELACLRN